MHDLLQLLQHAPVGMARLDVDLRCTFANARLLSESYLTHEQIVGQHIADLPLPAPCIKTLLQAATAVLQGGPPHAAEYLRSIGAAMQRVWIMLQPERDETNQVCGVLAYLHDVTAQRAQEQQTQHDYQALQAILHAYPDLYFWIDTNGIIRHYHADSITYVPPETFLNRRLQDVMPPDVGAVTITCLDETLTNGSGSVEYSLETEAGKTWFEARMRRMPSDQVLVIVRDITSRVRYSEQLEATQRQLEHANAQLQRLSLTDALTGIANRRAFDQQLRYAITNAQCSETSLSLLLIDVDTFKAYNDSYGHVAGDDVLHHVADCLAATVRAGDLLARFGGEEFVLLLPNTDAEGAAVLAERCRRAVAEASWPYRAVTVSIGTATWTAAMHEPTTLIAQADAALYAAKDAGRNRVVQSAPIDSQLTLGH